MKGSVTAGSVLVALTLLTAALAAAEEAPITIGVSPPRFELEIGERATTGAVRVFNFGGSPVEIGTSVHSWDLDERNELRLVEPDEQSLDQWMVVNPLRFTIPAGGAQTVRFSIRPKIRPTPGEHRAILYFEQAPRENAEGFSVVGRIGVAVYGYAGAVERVGRLHGIDVGHGEHGQVAGFDVSSLGSAHVRMSGQFAVWPAPSYPGSAATSPFEGLGEREVEMPDGILTAGFLPGLPVLPGSRRELQLHLPPGIPPGEYVLDLNGELSGVPIDLAVPFSVASADAPQTAAN